MCKYMLNLIFINKITLNYILLVISKKKAVNNGSMSNNVGDNLNQ